MSLTNAGKNGVPLQTTSLFKDDNHRDSNGPSTLFVAVECISGINFSSIEVTYEIKFPLLPYVTYTGDVAASQLVSMVA